MSENPKKRGVIGLEIISADSCPRHIPLPLKLSEACLSSTESAIVVSKSPFGQRYKNTLHARRKKIPYEGLEKIGVTYHSHPVASTDGTVGVGSIDASTGASLKHLATSAGNGIRLSSRLAGSSGVGTAGTGLFLVFRVGLTGSLRDSLRVLLVLVDCPVENIIILETLTNKEVAEDLAEVAVIRLIVESKRSSVVEVDCELIGESTAENLSRGSHLLFHNAVVLLLLGGGLQALPRERAAAEIEHNVTKGLHIITS